MSPKRAGLVFLATIVVLVSALGREAAAQSTVPNIVVILTDDQRWDTLWAMSFVSRQLVDNGTSFSNAYVTTPMCCPFRASFLSGGYLARDTGVLSNTPPNGGAEAFFDERTLGTHLQAAGYRTGIVGKYLNRYNAIAPRVPPGWDHFTATWIRQGDWFNFNSVTGSTTEVAISGDQRFITDTYVNDFVFEQAHDFVTADDDRPFFLIVSTHAPHGPATPLPRDEDAFSDFEYRDRAFGERNLGDKPRTVRRLARSFKKNRREEAEFQRDQLRSLQPVDREVRRLRSALEDDTWIIFTSDNGMQWGEHRLYGKGHPYEESLRVPLVMVGPGVPRAEISTPVTVSLDVPATILDLAGVLGTTEDPLDVTQGRSILPLLHGQAPPADWSRELFIENYVNIWAGLLLPADAADDGPWSWKYVEHGDGSVEAYDLVADPFEERSRHRWGGFVNGPGLGLSARLAGLKGLVLLTEQLEEARQGSAYSAQLETWGGTPPLKWDLVDRALPDGLVLDSATGLISGTPSSRGRHRFSVRVRDSSVRLHTGEAQTFVRDFELFVR